VSAANVPVGYASIGGFNANTPSTPGHLFQVTCAASCASFTWVDKTGNLPDIPADSVIVNPKWPQQVFVGTDFGLYFTDDITAASPSWQRFENGLPHAMIWDMSIDRGSTTLAVWTRSRGAWVWPLPAAPLNLTKVSSRLTHGSLGPIDLNITSGNAIEDRSGGMNNAYSMVFRFSNQITSCGSASLGTVSHVAGSNECAVAINVPTGHHVTVQLTGVTDFNGTTTGATGTMGVLVGDTNADAYVDAIDTSQTKSQSGLHIDDSNFREDVNADGFIDAVDVSLVKSQSGMILTSSNPSATPTSTSSPAPETKQRQGAGQRRNRGN
jgi:hypothetical protein